jgi:hypothetical protein
LAGQCKAVSIQASHGPLLVCAIPVGLPLLKPCSPSPSLPFPQAFALSQPEHPELLELLRVQPVLPSPGHRIVVEPPSTISEPPVAALLTAGGQLTSASGAAGSGGGFSWGGGGGGAAAAAEQDEEVLPDDVPLTRAQLQAKVIGRMRLGVWRAACVC